MARATSHSEETFESEQLRELREAEDRAHALRVEAIQREQARLQVVMTALNATPEELLGLPPRKRRRKDADHIE